MAVAQIIKEIQKWKETNDGFPETIKGDDWSSRRYRLSVKCRNHFSKVMCMDLVALYLDSDKKDDDLIAKDGGIDLDCLTFFVILKNGKVLRFTNSEWGGIGIEGKI